MLEFGIKKNKSYMGKSHSKFLIFPGVFTEERPNHITGLKVPAGLADQHLHLRYG